MKNLNKGNKNSLFIYQRGISKKNREKKKVPPRL